MKYRLTTALIFWVCTIPCFGVDISEDLYAGRPHFIIKTKKATYFLDKQGGGLSRMIDQYGNDWINYRRTPWNLYPESAVSSYRGLPNMVYRSEDSGVGHPGFDLCYSLQVDKNTILTISKSGTWQWRWKFFERYATLTMEKVDEQHPYWFSYEGVIAGEFSPGHDYWGTNLGGPRKDINDFYKGEMIFANWQWIYFGDDRVKQVLFVGMKNPDRKIDALGFLGNSSQGIESDDGMVVFGFGRQGDAQPQLTDPHNTFYFGFIKRKIKNKATHESLAKDIEGILK